MWYTLIIMSKLWELGDTVFLILRKRPVIFLHSYHHVLTFIYSFYAFPFDKGCDRWGAGMNFIVHSVMYSYFLLRALKVPLPRIMTMSVTSVQVLQFLIGSAITGRVFTIVVLNISPIPCVCPKEISIFNTSMYFSYLFLFAHFFYCAYIVKKHKKTD